MSSEARTLTDENVWELATWCGGNPVVEHDALDHSKTSPGINVPCGDEVVRASLGNVIIRKNDGTFQVIAG